MSSVITLCESHELPFTEVMEAVERFVDSMVENASVEHYEATAKRMFGAELTHEEIMLDAPFCTLDNLYVTEGLLDEDMFGGGTVGMRGKSSFGKKFDIAVDRQIANILSKIKLGREGLRSLLDVYLKMRKRNPSETPNATMVRAGSVHRISGKHATIIIQGLLRKNGMMAEFYMQMAEDCLNEEVPVNTSGSTVAGHEPTDGDKRIGSKKLRKRKEDEDEDTDEKESKK